MKLLLSVFAENLPGTEDGTTKLDPFVIITALPPPPDDDNNTKSSSTKPIIIGQTETLLNVGKSSSSIRWTKKIVLPNFELGQVIHLVVTVYNGRNATNEKLPIGSCLFEINSVLGCSKNSTMAKQMKRNLPNALLGLQIIEQQQQLQSTTTTTTTIEGGEHKSSSNNNNDIIFHYQLGAVNITSKDGLGFGIYNKSDPFYELQRLRYNSKNRKQAIWDTVYRSCLIDNNNNPIWPEVYIELKELLSDISNYNELIRVIIYDKDDNGAKELIGSIKLSINDFLNYNQSGYTIYDDKGKSGGALKILNASIDKLDDDNSTTEAIPTTKNTATPPSDKQHSTEVEEPEIVDSIPEEDIDYTTNGDDNETDRTSTNRTPTFLDYVKAGCELRVIIGIDTTASNGNPRQSSSLHYFEPDIHHHNDYEEAIYSICSILAKYDSDQKFPMYGFGSKIDGQMNHCFPFITPNDNDNDEADGVDGVLHLYRTIFRSGLVMSSPRNYANVIRQAGNDAKKNYEQGQSYSILLLFTNGSTVDQNETIEALKDVDDTPLSIVIIGVGENGDFNGAKELQTISQNSASSNNGQRDKLRFVHYTTELKKKAYGGTKTLSTAALDDIPHQLVTYFTSRGIEPLPTTKSSSNNNNDEEEEYDEIIVEPYNPDTDIIVPMEINSRTGEATVTDTVQIPPQTSSNYSSSSSNSKRNQGKQTIKHITKIGKDVQGVIVRSHQYRAIKQKVRSLF